MPQPSDSTRWLSDVLKVGQNALGLGPDMATGTEALTKTFTEASAQWTKAATDVTASQLAALKAMTAPWLAAIPGASTEKITDRRFSGEAWQVDPRYAALAQTYLAQSDLVRKTLDAAPIDDRNKAQWDFVLRQLLDALSPANQLATNPEALQLAMETGGASLVDGLRLFTEDFAAGRISMTDSTAFEVGRNIGTTPGAVVFQNDLIQLIQYTATTPKVHRRPLVIVPPCINKYYILDLQPANSFVAHAVAQGHTVFLVSWRNAGAEQSTLTWDDYLTDGVLAALDAATQISRADKVNTLGFCVGGTLLASALAVLWIVNEPDGSGALDADPDRWFDTAETVAGSWWPAWTEWLASYSGPLVNARKTLGNAQHPPIGDAPGSYVKESAS